MLMFLTEKTNTDFAHILVLTHMLVLSWKQSGMLAVCMFAPYPHWPHMSKMQSLDLDDGLSCGEKCSKNLYVQIVCVCCFVLLTRGWGGLETRPTVALGSFPELFAFTMSLSLPVYYEMSNSFRTANLLYIYRLPQSFSLRGRGSKHAQSQQICQDSSSERPDESPNTENVDITTEIRPNTWKFSFLYSPLESA